MSRLTITPPTDYLLHRDACSYGYFVLAPNHWDPASRTLTRALHLPGGPVLAHIRQRNGRATSPERERAGRRPDSSARSPRRGAPLIVTCSRPLARADRVEAESQVTRMLRLDDPTSSIREFHRLDPRFRSLGRGRLFRSPTLFEDIIKTVTSCNVQWPSTVTMNIRLCEVVGLPAAPAGTHPDLPTHTFPTPERLARTRPASLRARCRVGYRDARIVELARLFTLPRARGGLDAAWFEDPATSDAAIHDALLDLPGIGPYAAANIMQLLGRYHLLPLDTETLRHGRSVLGFRGPARRVMKRVRDHFAPFGRHAFRSYWFELWTHYESKQGPSWNWERRTTATAFTASRL